MRQNTPQPTVCHECGTVAAEAVCHICKTERPAYTLVKNMTLKVEPQGALDWLRRLCAEAI